MVKPKHWPKPAEFQGMPNQNHVTHILTFADIRYLTKREQFSA